MIEFFLLCFFVILSYVNLTFKYEYKNIVILYLIPLVILITFRQLGYDLNNYYSIYKDIVGLNFTVESLYKPVGLLSKQYEYTFHLLSHTSHFLGLGFRGLLFFYAIMNIGLLLLCAKLSKLPFGLFISAYLLIAFLPGPYEAIRSAIGILLSFCATIFYIRKKIVLSIFLFTLAFLFHKSIIIIPLVYILYRLCRILCVNPVFIYLSVLFIYPFSLWFLNIVIVNYSLSSQFLFSTYSILSREGSNGFANNTELLKYIIIIGRYLIVCFLLYFININIKGVLILNKNIRVIVIISNIMACLSLSLLLGDQVILGARVLELSYLFIIYLLTFVLQDVKKRKYNYIFQISCICLLLVNLVSILLIYLLPSGIPV